MYSTRCTSKAQALAAQFDLFFQFLSPFSINALAAGIEAGPGGKPDDITVQYLPLPPASCLLPPAPCPLLFIASSVTCSVAGASSHRFPVIAPPCSDGPGEAPGAIQRLHRPKISRARGELLAWHLCHCLLRLFMVTLGHETSCHRVEGTFGEFGQN